MPLINCETNLILTWAENCVISSATGKSKFEITDTKLYAPVVTLSTQNNVKPLQQLKSSFQRTINWNKYQSNVSTQIQNKFLDILIDPSFQGVNRLFILLFENEENRKVNKRYCLLKVEIKKYNVMIDGKIFFEQPVETITKTFEAFDSIWKIATGQGDDYKTCCLLDYNYLQNYYNMAE